MITDKFGIEGNLTVMEGQKINYVEHHQHPELAIITPADAKMDHVVVVPYSYLDQGTTVSNPVLPFDIEVHPSPPWNYRNRSRLQVRVSPAFAAGYFKLASHELLAVEQCPISSPLINRGIASLWQSGRAGKVPEGVRAVEFFAKMGIKGLRELARSGPHCPHAADDHCTMRACD